MYGALNGGGTLVYTYCAHASGSLRCAEIHAEIARRDRAPRSRAEIARLVLEDMHVEDEGVLFLRLLENRSQVTCSIPNLVYSYA